jgi:hypothetical protein
LISLRKFVPSLEYCKNVNSPSTKYDSLFWLTSCFRYAYTSLAIGCDTNIKTCIII